MDLSHSCRFSYANRLMDPSWAYEKSSEVGMEHRGGGESRRRSRASRGPGLGWKWSNGCGFGREKMHPKMPLVSRGTPMKEIAGWNHPRKRDDCLLTIHFSGANCLASGRVIIPRFRRRSEQGHLPENLFTDASRRPTDQFTCLLVGLFFQIQTVRKWSYKLSHRIHVWYIHLHLP